MAVTVNDLTAEERRRFLLAKISYWRRLAALDRNWTTARTPEEKAALLVERDDCLTHPVQLADFKEVVG